jgi:hypothetical protein
MVWRLGLLFVVGCAGKIDGSALCAPADAGTSDASPMQAARTVEATPDSAPIPDPDQCKTSADCDGELCVAGKCSPCTGPYTECFDDPSYGSGFFCFSGRCRSLSCSNENAPCAQIAGRECCNLGDGTLACVVGTCCNDGQCAAPETCQNHTCQ